MSKTITLTLSEEQASDLKTLLGIALKSLAQTEQLEIVIPAAKAIDEILTELKVVESKTIADRSTQINRTE